MPLDVLAIGAHPDDVELGVGGTLLKLMGQGHSVGILDLTRGESGSRGTVEERLAEAEDAARQLGVDLRENAGLPDGGLANTPEQRLKVIPFIRRLRPKIILSHMDGDRHPDHNAVYGLVRDANFFAGVASIETDEEPFRAPRLYCYRPYSDTGREPDLIVDITGFMEKKLAILGAYRSQLHNPDYAGPKTLASSAEFWETIQVRAAYWGRRIGTAHGEALYADGPVGITELPGLAGSASRPGETP